MYLLFEEGSLLPFLLSFLYLLQLFLLPMSLLLLMTTTFGLCLLKLFGLFFATTKLQLLVSVSLSQNPEERGKKGVMTQ